MRSRGLLLAGAAVLAGLAAVLVLALTGDGEAKRDSTGTPRPRRSESPVSPGWRAFSPAGRGCSASGASTAPLYVTAPPGDRRRVFVVEQGGRDPAAARRQACRPPVPRHLGPASRSGGEQGLLSIAFAPDYARSGRFYVYFTDRDGDTAGAGVPALQRQPEPRRPVHARGRCCSSTSPIRTTTAACCCSGPTACSTSAWATAAPAATRENNAQNLDSLLGKILRIDPRAAGGRAPTRSRARNPFVGRAGRDEIYAYGLRNPWRFSFDRAQRRPLHRRRRARTSCEEIDFARARRRRAGATSAGAASRARAASTLAQLPRRRRRRSSSTGAPAGSARSPAAWSCATPRCPRWPAATCTATSARGRIRSFRVAGGRATGDRALGLRVAQLSSFGEDARGRVYATSLDGPVYRLRSR